MKKTNTGNIKISKMLESKGLDCHPDKTAFLVIGSKEYKNEVETELKQNPIKFGDFAFKPRKQDLYLGDIISAGGLEASVEATVRPHVFQLAVTVVLNSSI